jgi:hypothetical protein
MENLTTSGSSGVIFSVFGHAVLSFSAFWWLGQKWIFML